MDEQQETYNLTMKSSQHNYVVYGSSDNAGLVSKNSHAAAYGLISFTTAYLKTHYPEEFMTCLLNTENLRKEHDKVEYYQRDLKNFGLQLAPKDINTCETNYKIVKKADKGKGETTSLISPSVMVKGIGEDAANELSMNRPYNDIRDIATKTGGSVTKEVIGILSEFGFLNEIGKKYKAQYKEKLTKEKAIEIFGAVRDDLKKVGNKGIVSQDLFAEMM